MAYVPFYSKEDTRDVLVYALVDPRDSRIRYIGQTTNLKQRMNVHTYAASSFAMRDWMGELRALKIKPIVVELQKTIGCYALQIEHEWLCAFKDAGAPLLNQSGIVTAYRAINERLRI